MRQKDEPLKDEIEGIKIRITVDGLIIGDNGQVLGFVEDPPLIKLLAWISKTLHEQEKK